MTKNNTIVGNVVTTMNQDFENTAQSDHQLESQSKVKTRSITFRLDSSVIDELQREADQKEISLNVLVNQALKRYAEWDRYENKIGMMPVPKIMLTSLIDESIDIIKAAGIADIKPYKDKLKLLLE
jgi:hypothetical protein